MYCSLKRQKNVEEFDASFKSEEGAMENKYLGLQFAARLDYIC